MFPTIAFGRFRESRLRLPIELATLAYIAGLVDGEGCFTQQNDSWRVQLAMTHEPVIRWLGTFGGTVRERSVLGNRQRCWRWLVMAQSEVHELLTALRPFLRVKAEQADVVLAHIEARSERRRALGI